MTKQNITLTPDIYFKNVSKTLNMNIRSELYSTNEFAFAVAVILSAQATDKKVNEVTPDLFKIASTPDTMLKLGEEGLKKHIHVISFFNNKAKNIILLSQQLKDKNSNNNNYKFPKKYHSRQELMKLPGIGQKTANVIMNVLWGAPNIGVDTHVFRLSHRFGWVKKSDNTPEKVEEKLLKIIPSVYHEIVNHVMVLHGRYTCKAIRPQCDKCPVSKWCNSKDKNI
ncbi:MAG: endonuclease III [Alphaproteobacteria bacterium]|nr:endonuclease III [Alphaproteobacteria bacterium]